VLTPVTSQDNMAANEVELVQARAMAAEATGIKSDAEAQSAEMQRLQVNPYDDHTLRLECGCQYAPVAKQLLYHY